MPEDIKHTPDVSPLYAAIGEMVVRWNQAEGVIKTILSDLCGHEVKTWILTAELGSVSLENALKSSAMELAEPEVKLHILHVVNWFSRLREFRNWYVHGIQRLSCGEGLKPVAMIGAISAKNRVVFHEQTITESEIAALIKQITELIAFASDVEFHVGASLLGESRKRIPPQPLPQMPSLPDRLEKLCILKFYRVAPWPPPGQYVIHRKPSA